MAHHTTIKKDSRDAKNELKVAQGGRFLQNTTNRDLNHALGKWTG